jgi:hypothetical protein
MYAQRNAIALDGIDVRVEILDARPGQPTNRDRRRAVR